MKRLIILGVLIAASTSGMPKLAESLGYPNFSIQDSMSSLKDALDSVTKAMGR